MYLMHYTNEQGDRVYTLKVRRAKFENVFVWHARKCLVFILGGLQPAASSQQPVVASSSSLPRAYIISPPIDTSHSDAPSLPLMQKIAPDGAPTQSAHPALFSPDDKFSRERVTCKKRFNLLPTQQPAFEY